MLNQNYSTFDSFDQFHVAVGITHFKLSTTFSKIYSISCKQNKSKLNNFCQHSNHFKKKGKREIVSHCFLIFLFIIRSVRIKIATNTMANPYITDAIAF